VFAEFDFSQHQPAVNRFLVFVQNITQPTPLRSAALNLSYDPSVTQISVLIFIPSTAQHVRSCLVGWLSSIPSHIHSPPQDARISQKSAGALDLVRERFL